MLTRIMFAGPSAVIVVGHSLYFRKLFEKFIDHKKAAARAVGKRGSGVANGKEFLHQLGQYKMANCAVVKCDLDFTGGLDGCIVGARMMFGTKLMLKGETDNEGTADETLQIAQKDPPRSTRRLVESHFGDQQIAHGADETTV